jgi:hypothetical protein
MVVRHSRQIDGAVLAPLTGLPAHVANAATRQRGEAVAAHTSGMDGTYSKRGDAYGRFATRLTGRLASPVHAGRVGPDDCGAGGPHDHHVS